MLRGDEMGWSNAEEYRRAEGRRLWGDVGMGVKIRKDTDVGAGQTWWKKEKATELSRRPDPGGSWGLK